MRARSASQGGGAPLGNAEDPALEEARRVFAEGVAHTQAQRWEEAVAAFEAALRVRATPPVRYNLAAALIEVGRHRDAMEHIEIVLASDGVAPNVLELTRGLEQRVRRETGRIAIELRGSLARAELRLDGEPLPERWVGREIPVSAGDHTVAAARGEQILASAQVRVEARETARAELDLSQASEAEVPLHEDWRFWLAVGGGAAVLITIVAIAAAAAGSSGGTAEPVMGNFVPGVITW